MNYYYYFALTFIPVVTSRKILRSSSADSSAEILTSSLQGLDEFTICGRIFSHQFSSEAQTFLHFLPDDSKVYSVALGTFPGYPCDDSFYQGNTYIFLVSGIMIIVFDLRMYQLYEESAWK